jgi:hypothetical protein
MDTYAQIFVYHLLVKMHMVVLANKALQINLSVYFVSWCNQSIFNTSIMENFTFEVTTR